MDAAVAGDIAGFELSLESANVRDGESLDSRPDLKLTVTLTPVAMRALGLLLLLKTDAPAFNEREWLKIAALLAIAADELHDDEARAWATQIRQAYS